MRLAITADLHWGLSRSGDAATERLISFLQDQRLDALIVAGDLGEGDDFARCLARFSAVPAPRLLIPGNHDLWVRDPDASSLVLYERRRPDEAAGHRFQYLDFEPWIAPDGQEAILGSINWYDYSFADPALERQFPDAREMYRRKLFPEGRHGDGQFVHLEMDDAGFADRVIAQLQRQVAELPPSVERIALVTHHPAVRELFYPSALTTAEQRFWLAYTGNRRMQDLALSDARIRAIFCGHTHAACGAEVQGRRCFNIGGDYDWKRLLLYDTLTGEAEGVDFRE